MRRMIVVTSMAFMLLNCSYALHTGSLKQYSGPRLAPAEESTLHFEVYGDISIDGVELNAMKPIDKPMEWSRCQGRTMRGCRGAIKIMPGKHVIKVDTGAVVHGKVRRVSLQCSGEFQRGKQYRLYISTSLTDVHRSTYEYTTTCEIRKR